MGKLSDYRSMQLHTLQEYTHLRQLTGRHRIARTLAPVQLADRALEVGCAQGYFVELYLRDRCQSVSAMDFDRGDVRRASRTSSQQQHGVRPTFVVADGEALPYRSCRFSIVYCLDVLEHVVEPTAVAREIARVTAPGGRVVVSVPGQWGLNRLDLRYPEHRHYSATAIAAMFPTLRLVRRHQTGLVWNAFWGTFVRGAFARSTLLLPSPWRAPALRAVSNVFARIADLDCRLNYGTGAALCVVFERERDDGRDQ